MAGHETISTEGKRLFAELKNSGLSKNDFINLMFDEREMEVIRKMRHLEAVWLGRASPKMDELAKAKEIVTPKKVPTTRAEKSLARMGLANYEPKYKATEKLKEQLKKHKK